jgi:hypothetical protein
VEPEVKTTTLIGGPLGGREIPMPDDDWPPYIDYRVGDGSERYLRRGTDPPTYFHMVRA